MRDKISSLIEDIYDAALEPTRWADVIVGINDFVGAQASGLVSKNSISKFGVTHYYCGADPHYIQLYSETYCKFDPLATLPPYGKVVGIPDLVPFDEYRDGRFYQEWLRPQGCVDAATVVLEKVKSSFPVLLTMLARKHMVDDEMRHRISLIVPHAHRALQINKAIEMKHSETATFADALNGLSAGVFIIDAKCRIMHANTAGHQILIADDFLRSMGGQLVVRNAQANKTLRDMFTGQTELAIASRDASFPLTAHDGERYVAHVLPLRPLTRHDRAIVRNAVAALFVTKVELDSQASGGLIARTFRLTPTELRVLLAIIDVGGVPQTAENLGLAETTVKTHLHRVFAKTGANRQADLVKIAAGYSTPLAI
jgi:DNA-binding CsgD family transcriptional regulator